MVKYPPPIIAFLRDVGKIKSCGLNDECGERAHHDRRDASVGPVPMRPGGVPGADKGFGSCRTGRIPLSVWQAHEPVFQRTGIHLHSHRPACDELAVGSCRARSSSWARSAEVPSFSVVPVSPVSLSCLSTGVVAPTTLSYYLYGLPEWSWKTGPDHRDLWITLRCVSLQRATEKPRSAF